jgi:hypothetical protein
MACVKWFQAQYPQHRKLLFSVPNGGYRNLATAKRMKLEGVVAGVSDLIMLIPAHGFHGLCIEMKTPKGRQTENQKAWQDHVEAHGYIYTLARSIEEFQNIINDYLKHYNQ